jgi:predicted negative regulator of RcsB-dependent stress response
MVDHYALTLMAVIYGGIFVLIAWAVWHQHQANKSKALSLVKEYEAEKANNENAINSLTPDKLVELANERTRRELSAGRDPKKE